MSGTANTRSVGIPDKAFRMGAERQCPEEPLAPGAGGDPFWIDRGRSRRDAMCPIYIVDADERVLDASMQRYALCFGPAHLPPAHAFWAVALYGLPENMVVRNPLNRYLINTPMLPDLRRDVDGGLTLCVQHESPGPHWECNWLPAPKGPFFMAMWLYLPRRAAVDRSWVPPALRRID